MKFTQELLDEIRSRVPVSQVVGRKVALKRAGREFKGLSPFRTEKTPSFTVNDLKGFYHCFASGEHGDIFTFVMKTEGLSFNEAVSRLAREAGVDLPSLNTPAERRRDQPSLRVTDRIDLIDKIGRALQARYRYEEIDAFLHAYGIQPPKEISANSKWLYSKAALRSVPNDTLTDVAQELGVDVSRAAAIGAKAPRNWEGTCDLRLFISHVSSHKERAARLKECLAPYAINGFVAHEDIHPTLEWQLEIERALFAMDAFLAVHTEGFSKSIWTQQEIGYALGRGVKVISFKMGEDPTGFISKQQALPRRGRTAEQIANEVDVLLSADPLTSGRLIAAKKARGIAPQLDDIPF